MIVPFDINRFEVWKPFEVRKISIDVVFEGLRSVRLARRNTDIDAFGEGFHLPLLKQWKPMFVIHDTQHNKHVLQIIHTRPCLRHLLHKQFKMLANQALESFNGLAQNHQVPFQCLSRVPNRKGFGFRRPCIHDDVVRFFSFIFVFQERFPVYRIVLDVNLHLFRIDVQIICYHVLKKGIIPKHSIHHFTNTAFCIIFCSVVGR